MEKEELQKRMINARKGYGVSRKLMSEILGMGVNVWANYEKGSIPNKSNRNLILLAIQPQSFKSILEKSPHIKTHKKFPTIYQKVTGMVFEIENECRLLRDRMNLDYFRNPVKI